MKVKLIVLTLLAINLCHVYGQSFQDVTAAESEDEINDLCASISLGFTSTPKEISNVIDEIVNTAGLTEGGFELAQCSNINNAIAKMLTDEEGNDVRYIIYDAEWLQSFNEDGLNDWSGKFVLAHEIGHHLNGHSLNNGSSNHQFELAADYFAGRALANLKATLAETLAVTEKMSTRATSSHPGRAERAAQAEAGWKSIENKTLTITVKQEDVSEIAREIVAMIEESLSKTTALTQTDYQIAIKRLEKVRGPNYYDGYTEDIRYLEAVALSGLTEPEKAMDSYINYLSIEGLEKEERIEQISKLFAKSPTKSTAFFTNPLVVYSLSKAYYKIKEYDNAISLGNQFLSRSEDEAKQLEVVKIIARSEFEMVESEMKELIESETITVKPEDESPIAREIAAMIEERLSNTTTLTQEDFQKTLKQLQLIRGPKYYNGYTEDIRYFEALTLYGLKDQENAMKSYINYLTIKGLTKENRIKQISKLFVESHFKKTAFFSNPLVIYNLCKIYYGINEYENAITTGNQFLSLSEDEEKRSEVEKIIANSNFEKIKKN